MRGGNVAGSARRWEARQSEGRVAVEKRPNVEAHVAMQERACATAIRNNLLDEASAQ